MDSCGAPPLISFPPSIPPSLSLFPSLYRTGPRASDKADTESRSSPTPAGPMYMISTHHVQLVCAAESLLETGALAMAN